MGKGLEKEGKRRGGGGGSFIIKFIIPMMEAFYWRDYAQISQLVCAPNNRRLFAFLFICESGYDFR